MNILSKISFDFLKKSLIKIQIFLWHLLTLNHWSQISHWMRQLTFVLTFVFEKRKKTRGMLQRHFKQLLILSVKSSCFIFNDVYYKQIDGVAMGSPLGSTLANLFLVYHECKWLESCPIQFPPKYYHRYVDDIFLV